jgi:excisionase family DNA binding protein
MRHADPAGVKMETVVLLRIPEVMERLSLGQTKVYELMSSGELRSVKVGRSRRIASDDLERFIAELDPSPPNLRLPESRQMRSMGGSS